MLRASVLLALALLLAATRAIPARRNTIAVPAGTNQIVLNATAISGVVNPGINNSYTLIVPADTNGAAMAFFITLEGSANCSISANVDGPGSQYWSADVNFPGRSPVYYYMFSDATGVGAWQLELSSEETCAYAVAAISMPAQPLVFGQGARFANLDPLAYVHYTYGSGDSAASAFSVSLTVPGPPPTDSAGCVADVYTMPRVGSESDSTWVARNASQVFPFSGIYDSTGPNNGEDWAESGFYPIGAAPIDVFVQARVNESSPCPAFVVNYMAQPAKPLAIGDQPVQLNGEAVFSDSIAWIFTVSQPAKPYSIKITYTGGDCPYVAWAGNDVASTTAVKNFALLGSMEFNSTASSVVLSGPASKTYIWTVRISGGDSCLLGLSAY